MSAYILSTGQLMTLAFYMAENESVENSSNAIETNFKTLAIANTKAVNYRYSERSKAPKFSKNYFYKVSTPLQIIELIHCFQYQCSELDTFENSKLNFRLLRLISSKFYGLNLDLLKLHDTLKYE